MLNMWFMTSNVLSTGSSKPAKRQTKKEVCETVIWAYLPCNSETEASLKLRSYIWGFLKYFCPHFACWCSGESTHSGGGIWRFGVLLHLRRFDSDFCIPWKSLEHWGVIESKRVVGWAKRCPLLITKLQGSQGLIAAMERQMQRGQPPQQPAPKLLSDSWSSACCSEIFFLVTVFILSI